MGGRAARTAQEFSAAQFAQRAEALYREACLARADADRRTVRRGLVPAGR